ncbi:MAG: C10 family peptidase [Chitinophagales bacterium]|nr:C10 family peptidase [Chitinophagales bacterium]
MQQFKLDTRVLYGLIVSILVLVLFTISCNKETDFKGGAKTPFPEPQSRSDENSEPSLFGNNHIVPVAVARAIAEHINSAVPYEMQLNAAIEQAIDSLHTIADSAGVPVMYIANYQKGGFVVIAADERHEPVCALVEKGAYSSAEVPSMLIDWFDLTFESIIRVRSLGSNVEMYADKTWVTLLRDIGKETFLLIEDCCPECPNYPECLTHPVIGCGAPVICDGSNNTGDPCWPYTSTVKGPLMKTSWGQGCTYNDLCPDKDCEVCFSNENAWTGCVATALAQIVKFWAHPGSQGYNYALMPNSYGNPEVQRLMLDAGTAVDMNYGCEGSGANGDKTDNAFVNTFAYSSAERSNYGPGAYNTIIQDVNQGRPLILEGCRNRKKAFPWLWYTYADCHMWVCDGYNSQQNNCYSALKFHMNWGWDGYYNGWYFFKTWNPGNFNYQYAQEMTHNIHP